MTTKERMEEVKEMIESFICEEFNYTQLSKSMIEKIVEIASEIAVDDLADSIDRAYEEEKDRRMGI